MYRTAFSITAIGDVVLELDVVRDRLGDDAGAPDADAPVKVSVAKSKSSRALLRLNQRFVKNGLDCQIVANDVLALAEDVPVATNTKIFGYLGIDSTAPGDLDEGHAETLRQLAQILAFGLSVRP